MNELDKKITLDTWRKSQLTVRILRRIEANLIETARALGEIKTPEEREAFERLEHCITLFQREIELAKDRFWEVSIEAMNASKN